MLFRVPLTLLATTLISEVSLVQINSKEDAIQILKGEADLTVKEAVMTNDIDYVNATIYLDKLEKRKDQKSDACIMKHAIENKNTEICVLLLKEGYAVPNDIPDDIIPNIYPKPPEKPRPKSSDDSSQNSKPAAPLAEKGFWERRWEEWNRQCPDRDYV